MTTNRLTVVISDNRALVTAQIGDVDFCEIMSIEELSEEKQNLKDINYELFETNYDNHSFVHHVNNPVGTSK